MESVLDMLKAKQNTANKLFCEKIIPTNLEILGVSIPEQRQDIRQMKSGVPVVAQRLMNPTRNREVVGLIPGLAQWVKDPAMP